VCLAIVLLTFSNQLFADDVVLTGNQVMVIENTTYIQTGNIFIRDNARLSIRNATLIFNQRFHEEFRIAVQDNGTFEVIQSIIKTGILPNENIEATFLDRANAIVDSSDLMPSRFYFYFGIGDSISKGRATISNSSFHTLSVSFLPSTEGPTIYVDHALINTFGFRFGKNYQGSFSDLKTGFHSYWRYIQGGYDIQVKESTYQNLGFFCDGPAQITVENSNFFQVGCSGDYSSIMLKLINSIANTFCIHGFGQSTIYLWELKKGFYSNWRLRDHAQGENIPDVILENAEITKGWLITSFGATLSIDNSNLVRLGSYKLRGQPNFTRSPTDITTVSNSTIEELMLYYSMATLIFNNTIIHFFNAYLPSDVTIKGNITFAPDASISNWVNSKIKRNYPILLTDQSGNSIPGASLFLYSKNGELVWSGATDENGKSNFDIEFNNSNYSDTWKLEISWAGKKFIKNVSLLSSTPIDLPRQTLSLSAGNGGTTDPAPGNQTYILGTEVTLRAIPDPNYRFDKWTGDASGSNNPITITMDRDKTIKANFIRQYNLTIEAGEGGTTNPAPGTYKYDTGTYVLVRAIPDEYYIFANWSGAETGKTNPISALMNQDKTIKANFKLIEPPLDFTGQKILNRSLSQAEYINVLRWKENPNNAELTIIKYRIYQVTSNGRSLLVELNPNVFEYRHRKVDKNSQYVYEIVVVIEDEIEGKPATITIR
jgi:uncharacterized repeat protein (TIGR02543 family)